jgi:hypothetical protein
MGDFSNFEIGLKVYARLAGTSMTKTYYYYVYRERQFLRLCQHTRIMGRHQREQQWANVNIERKDCFEKSQNCYSTGDRTAELNIHLEDHVSTESV